MKVQIFPMEDIHFQAIDNILSLTIFIIHILNL
jgi:hypothetical protein